MASAKIDIPCTCVLHVGKATTASIKTFNETTWKHVISAKDTRISKPTISTTSKYFDICNNLPTEYDASVGYHSACYKNFTAVPKIEVCTKPSILPASSEKNHVLRSDVEVHRTSSSGVLNPVCIFCKKTRKTVKSKIEPLGSCLTEEAEKAIKDAASILQDHAMLTKFGNINFHTKEVKYHHSCRRNYTKRSERLHNVADGNTTDYGVIRNAHAKAFQILIDYVKEYVIDKRRAELATSILERYKSILADLDIVTDTYRVQYLVDKIVKYFGGEIAVEKSSKKHGNVVYNSCMSKDDAVKSAGQYANSIEWKVTEAALHLRSCIQQLKSTRSELPYPLTTEALAKGEASPPDLLQNFYRVLYIGYERTNVNPRVERYVQSASQDAIFDELSRLVNL